MADTTFTTSTGGTVYADESVANALLSIDPSLYWQQRAIENALAAGQLAVSQQNAGANMLGSRASMVGAQGNYLSDLVNSFMAMKGPQNYGGWMNLMRGQPSGSGLNFMNALAGIDPLGALRTVNRGDTRAPGLGDLFGNRGGRGGDGGGGDGDAPSDGSGEGGGGGDIAWKERRQADMDSAGYGHGSDARGKLAYDMAQKGFIPKVKDLDGDGVLDSGTMADLDRYWKSDSPSVRAELAAAMRATGPVKPGSKGSGVGAGPEGPDATPAPAAGGVRAADGRSLAGESYATQAAFRATYGNNADSKWAEEHNKAIGAGGASTPALRDTNVTSVPTSTPSSTPVNMSRSLAFEPKEVQDLFTATYGTNAADVWKQQDIANQQAGMKVTDLQSSLKGEDNPSEKEPAAEGGQSDGGGQPGTGIGDDYVSKGGESYEEHRSAFGEGDEEKEYAEGGMFVAKGPRTITVGEGPDPKTGKPGADELVAVIPLERGDTPVKPWVAALANALVSGSPYAARDPMGSLPLHAVPMWKGDASGLEGGHRTTPAVGGTEQAQLEDTRPIQLDDMDKPLKMAEGGLAYIQGGGNDGWREHAWGPKPDWAPDGWLPRAGMKPGRAGDIQRREHRAPPGRQGDPSDPSVNYPGQRTLTNPVGTGVISPRAAIVTPFLPWKSGDTVNDAGQVRMWSGGRWHIKPAPIPPPDFNNMAPSVLYNLTLPEMEALQSSRWFSGNDPRAEFGMFQSGLRPLANANVMSVGVRPGTF